MLAMLHRVMCAWGVQILGCMGSWSGEGCVWGEAGGEACEAILGVIGSL